MDKTKLLNPVQAAAAAVCVLKYLNPEPLIVYECFNILCLII